MFFVLFLLIMAVVYGYPAWRLQADLSLPAWAGWLWTASVVVMALLPVVLLVALRDAGSGNRWRRPASWMVYLGLGAAIILFDIVLLRDVIRGGTWLVMLWHPLLVSPIQHAAWVQTSALACLPLALVVSAFAVHRAHRTPPVRHITVPISDLPSDLCGLRIAHISDLHAGSTIRAPFVERVVEAVNALQPDLIAFTGDLADGSVHDLADQVEGLSRLSAPLGVWFSTGNHDYYWDADAWMPAIDTLGMRLLSNSHETVLVGDTRLVLGGLPDPAGAEAMPGEPHHTAAADAVFAGAPDGVRVLLAHQPLAAASATIGAALTLSGHTHGGQILPWRFLVRLQQPIVAGLRRRPDEDGWIYVSRGVGYWGPPMRLGAPSEIACLTLQSA